MAAFSRGQEPSERLNIGLRNADPLSIQRPQIELGSDVPLLGRTEIVFRHSGVSALGARIGSTSANESNNRGYEKNPKHGLRQSLPDFAAGQP